MGIAAVVIIILSLITGTTLFSNLVNKTSEIASVDELRTKQVAELVCGSPTFAYSTSPIQQKSDALAMMETIVRVSEQVEGESQTSRDLKAGFRLMQHIDRSIMMTPVVVEKWNSYHDFGCYVADNPTASNRQAFVTRTAEMAILVLTSSRGYDNFELINTLLDMLPLDSRILTETYLINSVGFSLDELRKAGIPKSDMFDWFSDIFQFKAGDS